MEKRILAVAVRGWTNSEDRLLFGRQSGELREEFVAALAADLPHVEVWAPDLDMSMFSMRSAESLSRELFKEIDRKLAESPHIESIVILGYSTGSVLARRVFCMAHGATDDGTVNRNQRAPWADKIDRMVVLAGITRGWEFSSASPAHIRFLGPVLLAVARLVGWYKRKRRIAEAQTPLVWQLRRGSPFVVATRIQYVEAFQTLWETLGAGPMERPSPLRAGALPSTVFILGARDEFISPADCTELGVRSEFAFIEISGSNHTEAVQISGDSSEEVERRRRLVAALGANFEALKREDWTVPDADIDDYLDPMDIGNETGAATKSAENVEHAVMIVHGIRDHGFWTKRVAREIKTLARRHGKVVRAPTPSYGYFSMWDFVTPGGREQAAYWFMERYADVRSHFPRAKVSFVGHSNGTYIAKRAIELCPAIRFENIVFAGSVVRRDFRWSPYRSQVRRVLNYVGSDDGVVAFLPGVFELLGLRWLDVGGAGAFGFLEAEPPPAVAKRLLNVADPKNDIELSELRFVQGKHDAAIKEQFWPEIARFVLLNQIPAREAVTRGGNVRRLYRCAPVLTGLCLTVAIAFLVLPLVVAPAAAALVAKSDYPLGIIIVGTFAVMAVSAIVSWLTMRFLRQW
jgi:pimeloyl-ACP methyl ester carboxylesterase